MNAKAMSHPLVEIVRRAQEAVTACRSLLGPSKADTIKKLHDELCTDAAENAIASVEQYTDMKVREAQARFLPALEAAHNKLTQLRMAYDGTMGMSIDRDLERIGAMLQVAREAAK